MFQILGAKVFVWPAYHDTIPGAIIESMFSKLPVISYVTGWIPELNVGIESFMLVERFNKSKLAEAICYLLGNNVKVQKKVESYKFN